MVRKIERNIPSSRHSCSPTRPCHEACGRVDGSRVGVGVRVGVRVKLWVWVRMRVGVRWWWGYR